MFYSVGFWDPAVSRWELIATVASQMEAEDLVSAVLVGAQEHGAVGLSLCLFTTAFDFPAVVRAALDAGPPPGYGAVHVDIDRSLEIGRVTHNRWRGRGGSDG